MRVYACKSNSEPGCVRYEVLEDTSDPQTICLYEVFVDETAFQAQMTAPCYMEWMQMSREWRHGEQRYRRVLDFVYTPPTT